MSGNLPAGSITQPFRKAIQVGVVVRDIEQSMAALTSVFGMGPFRVVECPPPGREEQQFYHGEPARFRTRQAFADLGSVELELIQPLEGRTIWSDFLAERGPGIHHIRFNVPDEKTLTAYLQGQGIGKTQEGAGIREGSYWANYDTEKLVGFVIEILHPPSIAKRDAIFSLRSAQRRRFVRRLAPRCVARRARRQSGRSVSTGAVGRGKEPAFGESGLPQAVDRGPGYGARCLTR